MLIILNSVEKRKIHNSISSIFQLCIWGWAFAKIDIKIKYQMLIVPFSFLIILLFFLYVQYRNLYSESFIKKDEVANLTCRVNINP